MESQQSIKVSLVGFNEKMASSIAYFLEKHQHTPKPIQLTHPNDEEAMILVDGDSIDGQVYLTDTKSASHKILVAKFKADEQHNYPWLMKPVIPSELIQKLFELSNSDSVYTIKERTAHYVKDKSHLQLKQAMEIDYPNPQRARITTTIPVDEESFYQPKKYLQSVLQRCIGKSTEAQPLIQAHLPFGDVVVDADKRLVYLMIGQKHIRVYERLVLTELVMIRPLVNTEKIHALTNHDQVADFDDLLWDLSFGAACGRLPVGADVDEVLRLNHWPNLTRIRNAQHACQVAALWSQQPLSVRQVIEQLKIDHQSVYGFYAAATATGLLQPAAAKRSASPIKPAAKPSMMARLLAHLRHVS